MAPCSNIIQILKYFEYSIFCLLRASFPKVFIRKKTVSNHITSATTKYGMSLIFSADQDLDPDDSNKWIISVGHPSLGMSQSYFTTATDADKAKYKEAYIGFVKEFSTKYNQDYQLGKTEAAIDAMAKKVYDFENNIANMMWSR